MNLASSLIIGSVLLILLVLVVISYVKAPPSFAFIISGISKEPRVLIGKGGFRIPFLERLDKVYLGQITVDIKTETSVPTNDFINVDVDAVSKIRVTPTPEGIRLAAKNFLNMNAEQIASQLQDSLQGNMREIIGTLDLKTLNTDRDGFSDEVMKKANPDMAKLGIDIISCNIQNITDERGLIKDLGADNTAKIKKEAAITQARAEKDINIETSNAKKEANEAIIKNETIIAQQNTDLEITKADLKRKADVKKAEADMAYKIQEQEQQKQLNIKTVEAKIEDTKRRQTLSEEEIKIAENKLTADVNKKADADKYRTEVNALAEMEQRKRVAEAERYEAEQNALALKAEAEAKKYAKLQEAEGIEAVGNAEAEALKAKYLAEAEGLEKKAEAYQKYGQAAILDMLVKVMPQMAENIAKPISSIKSLNIYDGGVDKVSSNVPLVLKQTFDTIQSVTGVDMADIVRSNTIEAKTNRNISVNTESIENAKEILND